MDDLLVADAIAPVGPRNIDLATMSLAECPDHTTAIQAGIMHGLAPSDALKSSFGKWLSENHDAVQTFGLANFYDGPHAGRAFVNYSRLTQLLAVMVADQSRQIAALQSEAARVRALLPYLPPTTE